MKRLTLFIFLAFLMVACGNGLHEEVVSTFDNGQAAVVRVYDKDKQWVAEKQYYETGMLMMEGSIKDGQRDGAWTSYFPDGKVQSTGFFEQGRRTGDAKVYYENGNLYMEGPYKEDRHHGVWRFYDEQGYLLKEFDYGE